MYSLDDLRVLFKSFFNREKTKSRELKRIFQWRRYLEWKDLAPEEKLVAKRFFLVPVFAYIIIGILNQYFSLILIFLIGYILYKKFEKENIVRKK